MIETDEWNVAVLGGGIAACATAIALKQRGVERVCLLHLAPTRSLAAVGETVPPDIRRVLRELGVWDNFLKQRHQPCLGSRSAWGGDELGYNDFVLNPQGFGWHLDRARFEALLLDEAKKADVIFFPITRSASARAASNQGVLLNTITQDGKKRSFKARYAVDATGRRSAFARQMGARQVFFDRLSFVCGFFDEPEATGTSQLTLLEARESGWWYSSRLPDGKLTVAFASDASIIRDGGFAHETEWLGLLRQTRYVAQMVRDSHFNCIKCGEHLAHSPHVLRSLGVAAFAAGSPDLADDARAQ